MKAKLHAKFSAVPCLLGLAFLFSSHALAQSSGVFSDLTIGNGSGTNGVIVSKGNYNSGASLPSGLGEGSRFLWFPRKAAFRVGYHDATSLLNDNIGSISFAAGDRAIAAGYSATALGDSSYAWGDNSTAIGGGGASGTYSIAAGSLASASGDFSTAWAQAWAQGAFSTAMGNSMAVGNNSTSMGLGTRSTAFGSVAIGLFNAYSVSADPEDWIGTDTIFEIGNGKASTETFDEEGNVTGGDPEVRSNAVTVYKNGNMDVKGVITCAPGGDIPMFGEE